MEVVWWLNYRKRLLALRAETESAAQSAGPLEATSSNGMDSGDGGGQPCAMSTPTPELMERRERHGNFLERNEHVTIMSSNAPTPNPNALLLLSDDPNADPTLTIGSTIRISAKVSVTIASGSAYNNVMKGEKRVYGGYKSTAAGRAAAKADKKSSSKTKKTRRFTKEEDKAIVKHYKLLGAQWTKIKQAEPTLFQDRSTSSISQRYNDHLSDENKSKRKASATTSSNEEKKKKKKMKNTSKNDWDVESMNAMTDSDSDSDPNSKGNFAESTKASRSDRARRRQAEKENIQNMTEKLAA
eukprot:scaffold2944_cov155-Skeletonema_dohrnii-CCMP3373.AAC.26